MYKIGDYVVYKRDVCVITDFKENYFKDKDYYFLTPVYDKSLKISVPTSSELIRNVISKDEAIAIIDSMPSIDIISSDNKVIENVYKELLHNDNYTDLIKIIKTTYIRNDERVKNGKKISEKDMNYFNLAERYLYCELAVAMGISYDEMKEYIMDRFNNKKM